MLETWRALSAPVRIGSVLALSVGIVLCFSAAQMAKTAPPIPTSPELKAQVELLEADLAAEGKRMTKAQAERARVAGVVAERKEEKARLAGRVEARRSELARIEAARDDKAEAAQQEVQEAKGKAERELQQAKETEKRIRDDQITQAQLEKTLAESRFSVVRVLSIDQEAVLGSGFFLNENARTHDPWVVTTEQVVPTDGLILVRLTGVVGQRDEHAISLRAQTVYRDSRTGLVFLKLLAAPQVGVNSCVPASFSEVSVGDRVYAIGMQGVVGGILDNSVMEGNVSALKREVDGRSYLQLNLPANDGSSGAMVIDRRGKLVGVLVAPVGELERTSVAVSAEDLSMAMGRFSGKAPVAPRPAQQPAGVQPVEPKQDPRSSIPYDEKQAILLPETISITASNRATTVFAGPDDLIIVRDSAGHLVQAFSRKDSGKPVWKYEMKEQEDGGIFPVEPWGATGLLHVTSEGFILAGEIDLRTGSAKCKWTTQDTSRRMNQGPEIGALRLGDCVCLPGSGQVFDHGTRAIHAWPSRLARPLFVLGNDIWVQRRSEQGQTQVAAIPVSQMVAFTRQRASLQRLESGDSSIHQILQKADLNFQQAGKAVEFGLQLQSFTGLPRVIPGTHSIFLREMVIDFDRTPVSVTHLQSPRHSQERDQAFGRDHGQLVYRQLALNYPIDVSRDGRWLLLPAHVLDVRNLQPVAELPMICASAGFMADNKTIYVVDENRRKIGFLSLDELIKNQNKP